MYIRYVAMFHMAKRSGIQSILCDFRYATISWQGIYSRFSNFMQRPVSCLPWNYTLVHKTWNLPNNSEFKFAQITHDHFCEHAITKLSTVPWELGLLNNMQSWQAQLCICHPLRICQDRHLKGRDSTIDNAAVWSTFTNEYRARISFWRFGELWPLIN